MVQLATFQHAVSNEMNELEFVVCKSQPWIIKDVLSDTEGMFWKASQGLEEH